MHVILLEKIGKLGELGQQVSRQARVWQELSYSQWQGGARDTRKRGEV